jgi:hypothetical protein
MSELRPKKTAAVANSSRPAITVARTLRAAIQPPSGAPARKPTL